MTKTNRGIFAAAFFVMTLYSVTAWAAIDYGPWLTGVTQSTVTVKWGAPQASGTVEYGTTNALGMEADAVYGDGVYRADLTGLETGARYYYRVSSGGDVSDIHSFLTAPQADEPFHFAVISDTQEDLDVYYHDIIEDLLPTDPAFVLHNGDLVEMPFLDSDWTAFWQETDLLAGEAPYFPVMGNHDVMPGGRSHFDLYWTSPMNDGTISSSIYSFQYGNTYFIALDIARPFSAGSDQYQWLEQQLQLAKSLPSIKHCIVHAHFPPFSISKHGDSASVLAFREAVVPLFEEYDIDLYMSGHDHTYQRSVVNGINYLVTGCASGRLYDCGTPEDWTVVCEKTQNYSAITIDGDEISVEARRFDNSLIESFTINHNFHSDVDDDTTDDDTSNDDISDDDSAADDDAVDDDASDDDTWDSSVDDDAAANGANDQSSGCGC